MAFKCMTIGMKTYGWNLTSRNSAYTRSTPNWGGAALRANSEMSNTFLLDDAELNDIMKDKTEKY